MTNKSPRNTILPGTGPVPSVELIWEKFTYFSGNLGCNISSDKYRIREENGSRVYYCETGLGYDDALATARDIQREWTTQ